jgi:hypothetical protein
MTHTGLEASFLCFQHCWPWKKQPKVGRNVRSSLFFLSPLSALFRLPPPAAAPSACETPDRLLAPRVMAASQENSDMTLAPVYRCWNRRECRRRQRGRGAAPRRRGHDIDMDASLSYRSGSQKRWGTGVSCNNAWRPCWRWRAATSSRWDQVSQWRCGREKITSIRVLNGRSAKIA